MSARSPVAKVVSLILATSVVAGTVQWGMPRGTIELEGSGTPAEAKMGSRFEDMAVGTLTAMTPDDTLTPMAEPVSAEQVAPVPMAEPAPTPQALQAQSSALAAPVPAPLASVPVTSETAPVPPVEVIAAQSSPDTITAEDPDSDAPALSRRPQRKDSALAAKASEAQEKDARARRAAAKPAERKPEPSKSARGNADHNYTKGAQTGTRAEAKASQTGRKATPARQAGNAAASNYPGQVMRRIAQVGKPRVNARGTATIAFSITSGGGLAGVSVARSSGSASLDQAAVRLIRQAAPFPRPPAGAQRQFSIRIKGR
jgi:protein TonB